MKSTLLILIAGMFAQSANAQLWRQHEVHGSLEFFSEVNLPTEKLVAELDLVRKEVQGFLEPTSDPQNIQIVIFKSMANYRKYLSTRIPEARNRRAIFYKTGDQTQIFAVNHKELIVDLRHEFTHALLHESLPYIPLWIDEGVAEFLEERSDQRAKSRRLASMKWKCRTGWSPSLHRLESIATAARMTTDDYRDSWAWVHFLLNDSDSSRKLFQDYLSAISAGGAPGMFSEWAASRDSTVTKRVGSYFRRIRFSIALRPRR